MKKFRVIICAVLAILAVLSFSACEKDTTESASSENSFYATYKGVKIVMGADADGIIEALGEAQERKEIGDCGGLGAQVLYTYPSVEIYVLESKTDGNIIDQTDGNIIDQISFRDDIIATPEGVYIGMDVSDAKTALGEPDSEGSGAFEYENGDHVLVITHSDGKVKKIDYITK